MIDILLATCNGNRYLAELLESLEKQTYEDWKLLISDDFSSDGTIKIIKNFQIKSKHKVEIVQKGKKFGNAKRNFMFLLRKANSDYIMFCDQDDIWLENKIEKSMKRMKDMEEKYGTSIPLLVSSDLKIVDSDLNVISDSFYKYSKLDYVFTINRMLCQNRIPGCTMLINRKLGEFANCYNEIENISMHDSWISLIASTWGKISVDPETLILYRQHDNNSVGAQNMNSFKFILKRFDSIKKLKQENMERITEANELVASFEKRYKLPEVIKAFAKLRDMRRYDYRVVCIKYRILKYPLIRAVLQLIIAHR